MQKTIVILVAPFLLNCSAGTNNINHNNNSEMSDDIGVNEFDSGIQDTINVVSKNAKKTDAIIPISEGAIVSKEIREGDEIIIDTKSNESVTDNSADEIVQTAQTSNSIHQYTEFNELLSSHVSSKGKVNYEGLKSNSASITKIKTLFETNYPEKNWTKNQKLAYWINAYNFYTLKYVSSNYPTSSITKITAKPWDKKFILLGGETLSLNDIEHKKIRAVFNEPRIHFALNCASESCPILLNRVYTASNLNTQLEKQTIKFLEDASKNDFSNPSKIRISQLFDWYKSDFTKNGTIQDFFNKYLSQQINASSIEYLEYSWELND